MKINKILSTAFATIGLAVTISSCDGHIEYPDTAMKTCDILCTDGQIVRYDEMVSKGKTPIGVVFHVNQNGMTEGTGYAVYLWDIETAAYSDSLGVKHSTSADPTAFDGNTIPMPCLPPVRHQQPILSLPCGGMVRVPISLPSHSFSCFMLLEMLSMTISRNVVETSFLIIQMSAGTGVQQRSVVRSL